MLENPPSADSQQYTHDVPAAIVAIGISNHVLTLDKLADRQPGGPKPSYVLTMLGSVDKEKCGGDWYVDVKQERPAVINRLAEIWDNGS
ncbi:hypothetical protein IW262DRAFT_1465111 [Armillaria fumosa]|nr:hypothetical protein IW262DRAFT_1465111 [Armillaria fumosa]